MVAWGLMIAWRLATWPTRRWPSSVNATTDGVVRPPSALAMTSACPPSMTAATTEFVVPRSMPTAFAMARFSSRSSLPRWLGPVRQGSRGVRRGAVALRLALGSVAVGRLAHRRVALEAGGADAGDRGQGAGHPGQPEVVAEVGVVPHRGGHY